MVSHWAQTEFKQTCSRMVESQSAECYLTSVQKFGAMWTHSSVKKKEKGDKTLCEPQKHELNKPLKKILQKFRKVE